MTQRRPTTAAARAAGALTLPELRATLALALKTHPELRRGLGAALADVDRAMGAQRPPGAGELRSRRRGEGLE